MEMLGGKEVAADCRLPSIMSDAAYVILTRDARNFTGNFVIDEEILREEGLQDMDQYAAVPGTKDFLPDFFLLQAEKLCRHLKMGALYWTPELAQILIEIQFWTKAIKLRNHHKIDTRHLRRLAHQSGDPEFWTMDEPA